MRMIPESPAIRAATLLMPLAMSSREVAENEAHLAYS
jgi:hypothetical protein